MRSRPRFVPALFVVVADPPDAWLVSFSNSFVTKDLKSHAAFVRAVRGAF